MRALTGLLAGMSFAGLLLFSVVCLGLMAALYLEQPPLFVRAPAFREAGAFGFWLALAGALGLVALAAGQWVMEQSRGKAGQVEPRRLIRSCGLVIGAAGMFLLCLYALDRQVLYWQYFPAL